MNRFRQLMFAMCMAFVPQVVQADLIVSISPTPTVIGNDIYVDVSLVSNDPPNDLLSFFLVSYTVNTPDIFFYVDGSGNPDQPQLFDPNYVFFGNSLEEQAILDGNTPAGTVSNSGLTYTQNDATLDFSGVEIGSTDVLLAVLHLYFVGPPPTGPLSISLDSDNSVFLDPSGNSIPFNSDVNPVPEPSSLSLLVIGLTAGGCAYRRRRKLAHS